MLVGILDRHRDDIALRQMPGISWRDVAGSNSWCRSINDTFNNGCYATSMDIFLWFVFVGLLTIPAYLLAICAFWLWFRRRLPEGRALIVSAATVALLAFLVPIYGNWSTKRRFDALIQTNLLPKKRIVVMGDIRLNNVDSTKWEKWITQNGAGDFTQSDLSWAEWDGQGDHSICRDTCRMLLNTRVVDSVTVDPAPGATLRAPSPHAVTFRLSAPPCGGADLCFARVSPIRRFDFHVTESAGVTYRKGYQTGQGDIETRLLPRPLEIDGLEIRNASDRPVLRQTAAMFRVVKLPMMPAWSLSPRSPHVGFAAAERSDRGASDPFQRYTTVPLRGRAN